MSGPRQRSAQRPSQRARRPDPARAVAFDTLRAVAEQDAYANLVLPRLLRERRLAPRDAGFATELTYGALRMRGLYDAVLTACVDRPLGELDAALLDALRLGVHQLLGMRVPAHAAVSETVALVRGRVGQGPGGLANAVLRRVAERDVEQWVAQVAPDAAADVVGHLAVEHSHPVWVVRALREALAVRGVAPEALDDELAALLAADNAAPSVSLVARPGLADVSELLDAGATPGRWAPGAARWAAGDPGSIRAVREGRAGVQDEGSQLVARALADAPVEGSDEQWLDLCAGPGGKAALLGALARERGARLTAVEVAPHRADLVRTAVAPLADTVEVRCTDGREVGDDEPGRYDRVLVDAPCTGLGALRRRPEARWRRSPADLSTLAPLQRDLLNSAIDATRQGGVIAYSTCSPHVAETRLVVDDVVRRRDDVELVDASALVPVPDVGGPTVQLWPHRHGTDAMFLALLRRR
ncbi:RsmB/NOP family class I SAM-dependent RNA methyltransferase [Angustibacter sp. Root456]|uniref:RsmB/NOP family class I SAM-dependent RNA methyltransferase n=1 Tax=Angustibacter sp. Root456 TaxID=1736539 RepID=UPI0006FA51D8|nr:transcription antitermination factor NusB [Angustibacter sp. Root456]KQX66690.1 methyltransferase [Angustibacter sp. Root456]